MTFLVYMWMCLTFIWGADLPTGQRGAGFWLVSDGTLSRITARGPSAEEYFDYLLNHSLSSIFQSIFSFDWTRITNPAEKPRSLGSVDALSLNVEEESLVALKVGAGAALLAVLPRVPHHLPVGVNLVRTVMDKILRQCNCSSNFWVALQRLVTRLWKLVTSPQLRTKQHRFLIQRWCTCCRSLPVKDGPDVFWLSWLSVANKFHKSFGWKHVTS